MDASGSGASSVVLTGLTTAAATVKLGSASLTLQDNTKANITGAITVDNGSATAATLVLSNFNDNAQTIDFDGAVDKVATLNIQSTGSAANTATIANTGAAITKMVITGDKALNLSAAATVAAIVTVDASADTGGVTMLFGAANNKITGGSGADTFLFAGNLTNADTVDGGTGVNTIGVTAAIATANLANVTNFTNVQFDVSGASISQDTSKLVGYTAFVETSTSNTHTLTLSNIVATNNNVAVAASDATGETLTVSLKDPSGLTDALNLTLGSATAGTAVTVAAVSDVTGLETLNLASNNATATTANIITSDLVTAKHVITGTSALTINGTLAATVVDSTGLTGALTATGSNTGSQFTLGAGKDVLTLGTAADTVDSGAGNDTISLGAANAATGADVIKTGLGNDTVKILTTGTVGTAVDYSALSQVKDFTVGTSVSASDFLKFDATNTTLYGDATAGAAGLAVGSTKSGVASGDAAVVQSVVKDAAAAAITATTNVVKLATGVAFRTDFQTTFNDAIGTATLTGAVAVGSYLVSFYDTTNNKAVVGVVDSGVGNTVIASADVITVVGAIDMTATDYANFGATNFAAFV